MVSSLTLPSLPLLREDMERIFPCLGGIQKLYCPGRGYRRSGTFLTLRTKAYFFHSRPFYKKISSKSPLSDRGSFGPPRVYIPEETTSTFSSFDMVEKTGIYINPTNDFEKQLEDFFTEIKDMVKMGDKDEAADLLLANYEAVKEQANAGLKGIEQAATLDVIALGYVAIGELDLVECILHMLANIVDKLQDSERLLDSVLLHMGSMYVMLGKFDDAMLAYDRSLEVLGKSFGHESPFLVMPLLGIGKVFQSTGKASKAIDTYNQVVGILESNRGVSSEELVVPLFAVGNLFINEGRATDAETAFQRILGIYMERYGERDGRVGMAMCSLARVLCAKGSVNEAISAYEDGLQIIEDSNYVPVNDDILQRMRVEFAELLHLAGRENQGRELLEECLMIAERSKGSDHASLVMAFVNLASSHSRSKNYVEAERLLRACLQLMSTTREPPEFIAIPMLHLAVVLYNTGREKEAESIAKQVLSIREDAFGKHSLLVGEALDCLNSIQMRLGEDDNELLSQTKRILDIQEKELGYESEEVMMSLIKVIFFLDKLGKGDEKLPLQRRLSALKAKYRRNIAV